MRYTWRHIHSVSAGVYCGATHTTGRENNLWLCDQDVTIENTIAYFTVISVIYKFVLSQRKVVHKYVIINMCYHAFLTRTAKQTKNVRLPRSRALLRRDLALCNIIERDMILRDTSQTVDKICLSFLLSCYIRYITRPKSVAHFLIRLGTYHSSCDE